MISICGGTRSVLRQKSNNLVAFIYALQVTTDLKNTCTTNHTGTSASAPLAAGILALALQVKYEYNQ